MLLCSLPLVFLQFIYFGKFLLCHEESETESAGEWARERDWKRDKVSWAIHRRFWHFRRTRAPTMMSGNPERMPSHIGTKYCHSMDKVKKNLSHTSVSGGEVNMNISINSREWTRIRGQTFTKDKVFRIDIDLLINRENNLRFLFLLLRCCVALYAVR